VSRSNDRFALIGTSASGRFGTVDDQAARVQTRWSPNGQKPTGRSGRWKRSFGGAIDPAPASQW